MYNTSFNSWHPCATPQTQAMYHMTHGHNMSHQCKTCAIPYMILLMTLNPLSDLDFASTLRLHIHSDLASTLGPLATLMGTWYHSPSGIHFWYPTAFSSLLHNFLVHFGTSVEVSPLQSKPCHPPLDLIVHPLDLVLQPQSSNPAFGTVQSVSPLASIYPPRLQEISGSLTIQSWTSDPEMKYNTVT